jgi:hypothetical protein
MVAICGENTRLNTETAPGQPLGAAPAARGTAPTTWEQPLAVRKGHRGDLPNIAPYSFVRGHLRYITAIPWVKFKATKGLSLATA